MMIVLASTSPRRRQILRQLGLPFKTIMPRYHEKSIPGLSPSQTVMQHALGKAYSVAPQIQNGMVLACDTIVYFQKRIIGKPRNFKDAFRILGRLQGTTHAAYTGVAVLWIVNSTITRKIIFYDKTCISLKKMMRPEMRAYFRKVNPLDKAGAYALQSSHTGLVKTIKGSFLNAVGLPVELLKKKKIFSGA